MSMVSIYQIYYDCLESVMIIGSEKGYVYPYDIMIGKQKKVR